jgi:hypothetical protein
MSDNGAAATVVKAVQQRLLGLALGAALMLGVIYLVSISFTVTQPRSGVDAPSVGASAD